MDESVSKARTTLIAELLFSILPIIIVLAFSASLVTIRDLLFVGVILYGQSLVKFASGVSNIPNKSHWQLVALIVTVVICIGLVPSCILLAKTYIQTPLSLATTIWIWFEIALSVVSFFVVGLMGQTWLDRK